MCLPVIVPRSPISTNSCSPNRSRSVSTCGRKVFESAVVREKGDGPTVALNHRAPVDPFLATLAVPVVPILGPVAMLPLDVRGAQVEANAEALGKRGVDDVARGLECFRGSSSDRPRQGRERCAFDQNGAPSAIMVQRPSVGVTSSRSPGSPQRGATGSSGETRRRSRRWFSRRCGESGPREWSSSRPPLR